ncbi:MAG: LamG domain-containing protein [Kofleriaceae bacterium]|jgi:hypothetical protein|nr:LamG domain-containing protein [Kofleriaceae bacterium]
MTTRAASWAILTVAAACGHVDFATQRDGSSADAHEGDGDAAAGYAALIATDRPIAYWKFDEASGRTALDSAGNNPGQIGGQLERGAGVAGSAGLVFDGATTRVEFGDAFPFAGAQPYTLELWIKPRVVDDRVRFLISRRTPTGAEGYTLYYGKDFVLASRTIAGVEQAYAAGPVLVAGRFTHVAATYDGTEVALYLDGVYQGGMVAAPLAAALPGALVMGELESTTFYKVDGVVDEVAFYDTALAPARIAAHHAAGR